MTKIRIFMGLSPTLEDEKLLAVQVMSFWRGRLKAGQPLDVHSWQDDAISPPLGEPQVVVGFSFGATTALNLAQRHVQRGGVVNGVVLLDPVDFTHPTQRNVVGFYVPNGVRAAWCFYRDARQMPWSGSISSAQCDYYNKRYVPRTPSIPSSIVAAPARAAYVVEAQHGQYVWEREVIGLCQTLC